MIARRHAMWIVVVCAGCYGTHGSLPRDVTPDAGAPLARDADPPRAMDAEPGDAGTPRDAGFDAGYDAGFDAGAACGCFDNPIVWSTSGSLTGGGGDMTLGRCGQVVLRTPGERGLNNCSSLLGCGPDEVSVETFLLALDHPDVRAARAASPVSFGNVYISDTPLVSIRHEGLRLTIGPSCRGESWCTPSPPGVATLQRLLGETAVAHSEGTECSFF